MVTTIYIIWFVRRSQFDQEMLFNVIKKIQRSDSGKKMKKQKINFCLVFFVFV